MDASCIVAKLCEIRPKLLLITYRKSHIGFQVTQLGFLSIFVSAQ